MLIALLVLFQLILFAIGILGPWRDANATGHLPRFIRLLLSFSLVVSAFVIWQYDAKLYFYARFVAFGMLASFIGDVILSGLFHLPSRLIFGMIAFGIAHILYINAYSGTMLPISSIEPYQRWSTGLYAGLSFYGVLSIFGWLILIRNPHKDLATNIGALVYGMLVGAMAACALALGFAIGAWLTAIGGLFFVVSDFIIGITDIRGIKIKNANDWIWLTYVLAQAGIIYAGAI